jgi:hypothetical protein
MPHSRAHIRVITTAEATQFVSDLNSDGTANKYIIENFDCESRVNARSLLGVIYAMTEHQDEMFLVNLTEDGKFPSIIDKYRI